MEIKNRTLMEEKLFISFQRFSSRMFKKSKIMNLIYNIAYIIFLSLCALISAAGIVVAVQDGEGIAIPLFLIIFIVFLIALDIFRKIFFPKILYKRSPLRTSVYNYTFRDEAFTVEAKSDTIETTEILKYTSIITAYETKEEMFLYISPYQAMLVSKGSFESENDVQIIRELLKALLGNKYITVK